MLISILGAVLIFGVVILVHEAGHFAIAKRCGVRVLRFSIGYPPKLFGIRRGSTEYVISLIPFGGYVWMLGEYGGDDPASGPAESHLTESYMKEVGLDLLDAQSRRPGEPNRRSFDEGLLALAARIGTLDQPERAADVIGRELRGEEAALLAEIRNRGSVLDAISCLGEKPPPAIAVAISEQAFQGQPLLKRSAIVLAGPAANILFAPILLAIVFMWGLPRLIPILGQVKEGMPAAMAGLRQGDRVVAIDGHPVHFWDDLSDAVKSGGGVPLKLEIEREGRRESIAIKPTHEQEKTPFGDSADTWVIGVLPRGDTMIERLDPFSAAIKGVTETGRITALLVVGIAKIVSGATPVRQALGGPIMIAQIAGHEAHQGFASAAMFTVMLSIELGIINLLPVPMLDGGQLGFFAFEAVRGRPLEVRHREMAQRVGLILLAALMLFLVINDISRIIQS